MSNECHYYFGCARPCVSKKPKRECLDKKCKSSFKPIPIPKYVCGVDSYFCLRYREGLVFIMVKAGCKLFMGSVDKKPHACVTFKKGHMRVCRQLVISNVCIKSDGG